METISKVQSPTESRLSPQPSLSPVSSSGAAPMLANNSIDFSLSSVKNKRKNFSPRYNTSTSSANHDDTPTAKRKSCSSSPSASSTSSYSLESLPTASSGTQPTYPPSEMSAANWTHLLETHRQASSAITTLLAAEAAEKFKKSVANEASSYSDETRRQKDFLEFQYNSVREMLSSCGVSLSPVEILDGIRKQQMNSYGPFSSTLAALLTTEPGTTRQGSTNGSLSPAAITPSAITSTESTSNSKSSVNSKSSGHGRNNNNNNFETSPERKDIVDKTSSDDGDSDRGEDMHYFGYNDSNESHANDTNMSDDPFSNDETASYNGSANGGYLGAGAKAKVTAGSADGLLDKCSLGLFSPILMSQVKNEEKHLSADSIKHLTKFSSFLECKTDQCQAENLREHYHCNDLSCMGKVLSKKEEIIRHLKWHKKRKESLNHGFLRFSSSDDCSLSFGMNCTHNRKQTHYHCFQPNCDKVYISTSDVQMHSNYHRKDSAIFQEGFQRYRATEECKADYCMFAGQRTTHFHCRRDNCRFTFKNKADMEKHKTYHIKDQQLARDGFKKFLKTEPCPYTQCRFSRVCNHIHCVRENCFYVLHSSGQLLSHKRKHERVDSEQAYCHYKLWRKNSQHTDPEYPPESPHIPKAPPTPSTSVMARAEIPSEQRVMTNCGILDSGVQIKSEEMSPDFVQQMNQRHNELLQLREEPPAEAPKPAASAPSEPNLHDLMQSIQYYFTDKCSQQHKKDNGYQSEPLNLKSNEETAEEAATDALIECFWATNVPHLHCVVKDCEAVIFQNIIDITSHMRMHEMNRSSVPNLEDNLGQNANHMQITSIDGFFNRKRGRPPKNRVVEVYNHAQHSPQAIFTSFKLEKQTNDQPHPSAPVQPPQISPPAFQIQQPIPYPPTIANIQPHIPGRNHLAMEKFLFERKFSMFEPNENCGSKECPLLHNLHFHCTATEGCNFVTKIGRVMDVHWKQLHGVGVLAMGGHHMQQPQGGERLCGIAECSETNVHTHCQRCLQSLTSHNDIQSHQCVEFSMVPFNLTLKPEVGVTAEGHEEQKANSHCSFNEDYDQQPEDFCMKETDLNSSSASKSDLGEEYKMSVVRAAGTYFPQNTSGKDGIPEDSKPSRRSESPNGSTLQMPPCQRPFCKLKRKPHGHCDICNQGFSDYLKLKSHRTKHVSSQLGRMTEFGANPSLPDNSEHPQDLSLPVMQPKSEPLSPAVASNPIFPAPSNMPHMNSVAAFPPILPPNFSGFHFAHLASLYQQNPYMYHNFYPMLRGGIPEEILKSRLAQQQYPDMDGKSAAKPAVKRKSIAPQPAAPAATMMPLHFPMGNVASMAAAAVAAAAAAASSASDKLNQRKRKAADPWMDMKSPGEGSSLSVAKPGNFKMFKDEPIPTGYLKFRFNEDCNFSNCGYRNHQSHFHCIRTDCYYSFCDKTRFVQHTARHERLDKLMGDDFKQYRANMRCGYDDCAYNNNLAGANNKSSHFHCLKCNFICSDTNKVVAHRRQHSKMEYIRMAGFRKVANNEKCTTTDSESGTGECSYSLKQTHYHCLVCECGVLSRAQLGSHKHRA